MAWWGSKIRGVYFSAKHWRMLTNLEPKTDLANVLQTNIKWHCAREHPGELTRTLQPIKTGEFRLSVRMKLWHTYPKAFRGSTEYQTYQTGKSDLKSRGTEQKWSHLLRIIKIVFTPIFQGCIETIARAKVWYATWDTYEGYQRWDARGGDKYSLIPAPLKIKICFEFWMRFIASSIVFKLDIFFRCWRLPSTRKHISRVKSTKLLTPDRSQLVGNTTGFCHVFFVAPDTKVRYQFRAGEARCFARRLARQTPKACNNRGMGIERTVRYSFRNAGVPARCEFNFVKSWIF